MKTLTLILSRILVVLGLIMINLAWIVFLLILAADILFGKNYPLFKIDTLSLFGTPLELFIGGVLSIFISSILAYLNINK